MWPFKEHNCVSNVVIPDMVECDKCKHLILKTRAQEKTLRRDGRDEKLFFCPEHKVRWDRVWVGPIFDQKIGDFRWDSPPRRQYFVTAECDESGKIIKGGI